MKKLTAEEESIFVHKGTEAHFTGKYFAFWKKGTSICKS
jgi:peptide methionine sulfoxide reductase MsrB